jgi:hypothetical protein
MKKREEKQHAARKADAEPCLYCGKLTVNQKYIVNPGAEHELPCCSKECHNKATAFIDYDKRKRMLFYMLELIFVVANLFILGFELSIRWKYLPMLGMGVIAFVYPLVFTRYERYQKYGIHKTQNLIRSVAVAIVVFALVLTISY